MKIVFFPALVFCFAVSLAAQQIEPEIERRIFIEVQKLKSADTETRRDSVYKLGLMQNAVASRAAAAAVSDSSEIVRAEVARAVVHLAAADAVRILLPLLSDKSEFVRREAAYALGRTFDENAAADLIKTLQSDKAASVRAAAAIALGQIADESAVEPLSRILLAPKTKQNRILDEFVRRSAAKSLGEIRRRRAVPALIAALRDRTNTDDVRRESARALGFIADDSAFEILRENLNAEDYYLAEIAAEALERIRNSTDRTPQTKDETQKSENGNN